jgi:protoporphyrinogen IX oxidase
MSWFAEHYQTLRALHIIAVIAWMAGMMYLPRLYVYHSTAPMGGELDATLKVMERRLLMGIMNPAIVVVWALGLSLIVSRGGWDALSWHWFDAGERPLNHVAFRWINEAPFVLMIGVVLLAVLEPAWG